MAVVYVYAHRVFLAELETTDVQMDRVILDDLAFAGEPVSVKVEVLNRNPSAIHGTFEDVLPTDSLLADGTNKSSLPIPPRSILRLSYSLIPSRRGTAVIPGMKMSRTDTFGMLTESQFVDRASSINVHTQRDSVNTARKMAGKEHLEFSGTGRNPAIVLRELEFDGIREYIPGDRARDIHWKLLPKLNKLMTKTYRKEGSVHTTVFVDCGRSMRLKTYKIAKIDHALDLSIQLSNVLLSGFNPAGAAAFDEVSMIDKVPPALGRRQFEKIVKMLRKVPGAIRADSSNIPAAASAPTADAPGKRASTSKTNGEGKFLSVVDRFQADSRRKMLGMGLEGGIKEILAKSRGQEQLFIVISDLISSRDAVLSGAGLCQSTGNRILVIHTYDDWYRQATGDPDAAEAERLYGDLTESLKLEGRLRGLGATYIRIGPADSASRIARAIRRGKT
ncbi:MAG TPA: DUF58 domain-containing protein [Thermoplasmata archaeon]